MDIRQVFITAALLAGFTAIGVGLVALTELSTKDRIAANEEAMMLARVAAVLIPGSYDNDPVSDTFALPDPTAIGMDSGQRSEIPEEQRIGARGFRARLDGTVTAVVLPVVARGGYGGDIHLLVGVDPHGVVTGVRVTRHRETPGLGDPIEAGKSDWILSFDGKSLDDPAHGWAVRKDGGVFDQFTGATITPRAVVNGVYNALQYVRQHRNDLFELDAAEVTSDE